MSGNEGEFVGWVEHRDTQQMAVHHHDLNVRHRKMELRCNACGVQLTEQLVELTDEKMLSQEDKSAFVPKGKYFVSSGEYVPEQKGDFLVNLSDLVGTQLTKDPRRLNGCCGLDGLDGLNLLCPNGHEVGTERSDCWLPHYAILSEDKVTSA